eukprot:4021524-Amphidinium_carterae.1
MKALQPATASGQWGPTEMVPQSSAQPEHCGTCYMGASSAKQWMHGSRKNSWTPLLATPCSATASKSARKQQKQHLKYMFILCFLSAGLNVHPGRWCSEGGVDEFPHLLARGSSPQIFSTAFICQT